LSKPFERTVVGMFKFIGRGSVLRFGDIKKNLYGTERPQKLLDRIRTEIDDGTLILGITFLILLCHWKSIQSNGWKRHRLVKTQKGLPICMKKVIENFGGDCDIER